MRLDFTAVVPWAWDHQGSRPCEWGQCGHCDAGRHHQCHWVRDAPVKTKPAPHTWILDRTGHVVHSGGSGAVYIDGVREHWICSCHRAGHPGHKFPDVQLDIFGATA